MCLRPEFATGSANCRQRAAQAATYLTADDTNIEPNLTFLSRDLLEIYSRYKVYTRYKVFTIHRVYTIFRC